jgi:AraC family transcriptional activator of pobA
MVISRPATPVAFLPRKYGQALAVDSSSFARWTGIVPDGERHVLDFHEFLIIASGRARIAVNGSATVVEGPSVFFTPPGAVRRVDVIDPVQLELVVWSTGALRHGGWIAALSRLKAGPVGTAGPELVSSLAALAAAMQSELRQPSPDSGLLLDALLTQFLIRLNRSRPHAPAPVLLSRFDALLEHAFCVHHDVAHYANALGVTVDYLSSVSRAHRGVAAKAVIDRRLFNEAALWLSQTGRPVSSIAASLGFDEPSQFTRFFTRMSGSAPTEFRRRASEHGIRQVGAGK